MYFTDCSACNTLVFSSFHFHRPSPIEATTLYAVGMLVCFDDPMSYAVGSLELLVGSPKADRSEGSSQTKSSLLPNLGSGTS